MSTNSLNEFGDQPPVQEHRASPAPIFDPGEYLDEMSELGLSHEQATEILGILWQITGFFARTGFEVDVCGLIFDEFNEASASAVGNDTLTSSTDMESASKPDGGRA